MNHAHICKGCISSLENALSTPQVNSGNMMTQPSDGTPGHHSAIQSPCRSYVEPSATTVALEREKTGPVSGISAAFPSLHIDDLPPVDQEMFVNNIGHARLIQETTAEGVHMFNAIISDPMSFSFLGLPPQEPSLSTGSSDIDFFSSGQSSQTNAMMHSSWSNITGDPSLSSIASVPAFSTTNATVQDPLSWELRDEQPDLVFQAQEPGASHVALQEQDPSPVNDSQVHRSPSPDRSLSPAPDSVSDETSAPSTKERLAELRDLDKLGDFPTSEQLLNWAKDFIRRCRRKGWSYVCPACGRKQRRPSALKCHLLHRYGIQEHPCSRGCGLAFTTKANKKRHEKSCQGPSGDGSVKKKLSGTVNCGWRTVSKSPVRRAPRVAPSP
ncbi:hypothetical protein RhiJN_23516 [Ceratobasidium sp. AG-Ba]|nr:hypothetical protein RhiJN_23516 [Ceratobasidium sp. AG-Ba]